MELAEFKIVSGKYNFQIHYMSSPLLNKVSNKPIEIPDNGVNILEDLKLVLENNTTNYNQVDYEKLLVEYDLVCIIDDMLNGMTWFMESSYYPDSLYEDKLFELDWNILTSVPELIAVSKWLSHYNINSLSTIRSSYFTKIWRTEYYDLKLVQKASLIYLWHNTESSIILPLLLVKGQITTTEFFKAIEYALNLKLSDEWLNEKKDLFLEWTNKIMDWQNRLI